MKQLLLISMYLSLHFVVNAQELKDSFELDKYTVSSKTNKENIGTTKIKLPLDMTLTLSQALNDNSLLFIKQNTPTGLSSVSMRGMGAQHTALVWNGINLQSCMNGIKDLNLIPTFFIEHSSVETGASSALVGQGALAGAIKINNYLNYSKNIKLETSLGSFENYNINTSFSGFYKKLLYRTKLIYRTGQNDFSYVNYFKQNKPTEQLLNNELKQYGLMQELSFNVKKHLFYSNFWATQTFRNLPSAIGVATLANEKQNDYNYKFLIQHQFQISSRIKNTNRLCLIQEQIDYFNDFYTPSLSLSQIYIQESEFKIKINKYFNAVLSFDYNYQKAKTDGYASGNQRNMFSMVQQLNFEKKSTKVSAALRSLNYDQKMAPLSPEIGFEHRFNAHWSIKSNSALSFRLPSFNDLYWNPGGNKNLKPEKGYKTELTTLLNFNRISLSFTYFNHLLNDWILWQPSPNSSFWTANNAKQVKSEGLEFHAELLLLKNKKHELSVISKYQYVQSINTKTYESAINSIGKQLIYTPNHKGIFNINYKYQSFNFQTKLNYTGSVFTTDDNSKSQELASYFLINTELAYQFQLKKHQYFVLFQANNLLNKTYQVMLNRAMPLRNYQITLKTNINYEKN